jgi:putative FmdB family regulatory protein
VPLYEYECRNCEHVFEELVTDNEAVTCRKCHSRDLERLLSVPAEPRSAAGNADLRVACRSEGPPCGPQCRRF